MGSKLKRWLIRGGLVILAIAIVAAAYMYYQMRSRGFWRIPVYETVAPNVPPLTHPAILVFSKTNSFIHVEAIPAAETLIQALGKKHGWSVYVTENGAINNPKDLAKFDTVIWNNVTGNVLTTDQQNALVNYLQNGGGWIGLHGAGDSSSDWDWYKQTLVGAIFIGHPYPNQFQTATMQIENRDDPIVNHLGTSWTRVDEWYSFEQSPRKEGVQILATLDESTYTQVLMDKDISMGADHPIIWKRCVENGRAFYSALGHTAESYSEPDYVTLLERAIAWTAGLEGTGCAKDSAGIQEQ